MYDLIVIGGGTSGCACAYTAGKLGMKVLVIEKNIHLGGTITSGLVTPVMKTNTNGLNCDFFEDFVKYMQKYNAQITYSDGNRGWFNPEIAKIVLDEMLSDAGVEILYDCTVKDVSTRNNTIKSISIEYKNKVVNCDKNHNLDNITNRNISITSDNQNKELSLHFVSKYYVDSTGDGNFCKKINHKFLSDENKFQAMTLRFLISGVDLVKFKNWVTSKDKNTDVTNYCERDGQLHLTTAYTWDSEDWGLTPVFKQAVKAGDLRDTDTAYFQLFTVAGMPGTVSLNCPRIMADRDLDPLNPFDVSFALKTGRAQIWRIYSFCKKYFEGFENSYISNIADMLGIRESGRIKGKFIMSENDILNPSDVEFPACSGDYPIDVHSTEKNSSELNFVKKVYTLPIESLMSDEYENLFFTGRCFSGTFKAQAALRTQMNCFSMGEAIAKYVKFCKNNI